jgi:hypothetical protein
MPTVSRFVITEDGQPEGVVRGHGEFVLHVRMPGIGISEHSCVWGTIAEVQAPPGEPFDFPFMGDAAMTVMNVAPRHDEVVDVRCQINWDSDLNARLELIKVDD